MSIRRWYSCALAAVIVMGFAVRANATGLPHSVADVVGTTHEFYGFDFRFDGYTGDVDPTLLFVTPFMDQGKVGIGVSGPLSVSAGTFDDNAPIEQINGTLLFNVSPASPNRLLSMADLQLVNPVIRLESLDRLTDGPSSLIADGASGHVSADLTGGGVNLSTLVADTDGPAPPLTANMPSDWSDIPGTPPSIDLTLSWELVATADVGAGDLTSAITLAGNGASTTVDEIRASFATVVVPEPTTATVGLGIAALIVGKRRRRSAGAAT